MIQIRTDIGEWLADGAAQRWHKLSEVLTVMRKLANQNGWKTSVTDYRQWGAKSRILRFSKSGNPVLEKLYATHYIGKKDSVNEA